MYYYIIINIIIYLYGGIILIIPYNKDTFRAVSVRGVSQLDLVKNENYMMPLDSYYEYINDTLAKAKSINADFISYAEEAFSFEEENYDKFINKVLDMIKYYKIDTLLSLDIHYKKEEIPNKRNMNMFIQSNGEIKYNYTKHNLIPIVEFEFIPSKEPFQVINTKYGKLSVVICYDINYPIFINSLSKKNIDILIVPSWDYPGVAEFQSKEARFKAIEGGFNLVKNTANGVVIASDYKGRILSYYSGEKCEDYFIVSELYKHGVKTLYSYIGKYFNYLYLIILIVIISSSGEKENNVENLKKKTI
jgi:apolipoprotein N-acyltransferase